jgi:hypothetical protein
LKQYIYNNRLLIKAMSIGLLLVSSVQLHAQKTKKVQFVGGARSLMNANGLTVQDTTADTTTVKRKNGGYALLDLGVNIRPNKNTEIMGMFRIRNEYGGFWGSGVSFDVRQLWVKGIIANAVRYQLGDLNLKQSKYTLYNHHADQIDSLPLIFQQQNAIIGYDKFYMNNNTWRMQGAHMDFGLNFAKIIKEITISGFITRLNPSNFSTVNDRLMNGLSLQVIQSKNFSAQFNRSRIFDLKGTVTTPNIFSNAVNTFELSYHKMFRSKIYKLSAELGNSRYAHSELPGYPVMKDYFITANAQFNMPFKHFTTMLDYMNVGPDFRSLGAQSKDIDYNLPTAMYSRIGNSQQLRTVGLMDVIANDNLYNRTISSNLISESQIYNNILPYGMATFNRQGVLAKVIYNNKKYVQLTAEFDGLSEIRGQGSDALKQFTQIKAYAGLPVHQWLSLKRRILVQLAYQSQSTSRNSNAVVENVDLKSDRISAGIRWEFSPNFELMGGFISQNTQGIDFMADRNTFTEVVYFNQGNYNVKQQVSALGIRYNFSSRTYISALWQSSQMKDASNKVVDYTMNQAGIIYSIAF